MITEILDTHLVATYEKKILGSNKLQMWLWLSISTKHLHEEHRTLLIAKPSPLICGVGQKQPRLLSGNQLILKLMHVKLTDCQVDIIAKTLEPQFMGPTKFLFANEYNNAFDIG